MFPCYNFNYGGFFMSKTTAYTKEQLTRAQNLRDDHENERE